MKKYQYTMDLQTTTHWIHRVFVIGVLTTSDADKNKERKIFMFIVQCTACATREYSSVLFKSTQLQRVCSQ